jgi:PBSX family phage terminase large subunit
MDFAPHSQKQEDAILSDKRLLVLGCGTQYGKTTVGALRFALKFFENTDPNAAFLVTAPTYKVMAQSTWPAFFNVMRDYGRYDKKNDYFQTDNGPKVYFRTESDPDSIIGITNIKHIWCDEAGKYRLYFWENIQARADFCGATIDLTTSPYSMNWIWHDIIKPWRAGKRKDANVIQAASWENPYHYLSNPDNREAKRSTMDPRRFSMIFGGEWGKQDGLVYDCWEDNENLIDAFALPTGTRYFAGIDWGYYPDPFVIVIRGITPEGRHYGVSEFVKTKLTVTDIAQVCKQKMSVYPIEQFYCDPSRPDSINELCRMGVPASKAINTLREGIDVHYELIKTRRYKEFRGSMPMTHDEMMNYHYPEPKEANVDSDSKEIKPVDKNNHTMDASRYVSIMTHRLHEQRKPFLNKDDAPKTKQLQQDRLKGLLSNKKPRNGERWQ